MSIQEATDYVDTIIETLVEWGIISEEKYGKMNENQRTELAEKLVERSES